MPSLKDVAAASGVSIRTVSRVMNESPFVSEATRSRVLKLATKMGYEPNISARALRMGKSFEVVAIIPSQMNDLHVVELGVFEHHMREEGYPVSILVGPQQPNDVAAHQQVMKLVMKRAPAGVAFFPKCHMPIQRSVALAETKGIPSVVLDSADPHVMSVGMDRPTGVYDAVKYLAEKGRRRIAYLGYIDQPPGHVSGRTRLLGYDRAVEEFGLPHAIVAVPLSYSEYEGGRYAAARCLASDPRPDAVQVYSDKMAAGVLSVFHEEGIAVPGDIAVVGFGDIEVASLCWPRLTTVAQPMREMAREAGVMLMRKMRGDVLGPEDTTKVLPSSLVVRESA